MVRNIRCRKTAHPNASTPCPTRFGVNLLRRLPLGFKKKTQSAAYSIHIAPEKSSKGMFFKDSNSKRLKVLATYLIEGHYKIPQDHFITRRLNQVVPKKGKLELSKLIYVTTASSLAQPDVGSPV